MDETESIYVNGELLCEDAEEATNIVQKAIGRMFTLSMPDELGLVFPFEDSDMVAIHMMFVFYELGAIWVDDGEVVEARKLRPWIGRHKEKSDTVIEAHPDKIDQVEAGDKIEIY